MGQRWVTSDEGHFMVQVPAGKHRVEVKKPGYRQFTTEIEVGDGQTVPLNVSLMTTSSENGILSPSWRTTREYVLARRAGACPDAS